MALIGLRGSNHDLLLRAFEKRSLILDCANCANPHSLFPEIPYEKFHDVFVLEVEIIYKFRDTLKEMDRIMQSIRAERLIVTPFDRLFYYDDEKERENVLEHAWELMKGISKRYDVYVGVKKQEDNARRYCDKVI
ncbi:hypothetical protein JW968_02400 [Candidatus Woesearchaeota archaeon]|nr:hypothetical protein [Candidatus Woesearchaeota archaeon]